MGLNPCARLDAAFRSYMAPPDCEASRRTMASHRPASSLYILCSVRRNQVAGILDLSGSMLNEVYNRRIIELAGNIPRLGRLDRPDATATAHSKLCGSTVTVDLKMTGDEVT